MRIHLVKTSRVPSWPASVTALVLLWLVLAIAGVLVTRALHQRPGAEMTLCTFKTVTGHPCLTCGAGRGALSLLNG